MRKWIISLSMGLAITLSAQVLPVGTVDGIVKDPSGALLTGIKVTLQNIETAVSSETVTNDSGYFFFPLVAPGRYNVVSEKPGFKKGTQEILVRTGIRSTPTPRWCSALGAAVGGSTKSARRDPTGTQFPNQSPLSKQDQVPGRIGKCRIRVGDGCWRLRRVSSDAANW